MTQDIKKGILKIYKARDYTIKLCDYDIEILKQRPRCGVFANHVSSAIVTEIVNQILKQYRKEKSSSCNSLCNNVREGDMNKI